MQFDVDVQVVAGRDAFLISSEHRSKLIAHGGRAELPLQRPKRCAVDTVVHDGALITAMMNSMDTFSIWTVDDPAGWDPKDPYPHARVVRHGYLGTRAVAFMGGDDGVVRVWELAGREVIAELVVGQPVLQIVVGDVVLVRTAGEVVAFEYVGVDR